MRDKFIPKDEWPDIDRNSSTAKLPYCYKISDDNRMVAVPDYNIVKLIEIAFDHLDNGESLRGTARWLSEEAGKILSHQGLNMLWKKKRGQNKETPRYQQLRERKKRAKEAPKEVQQARKANIHIATQKRSIIAATKRLEKAEAYKERVVGKPEVDPAYTKVVEETGEIINVKEEEPSVVFSPNPGPQSDFLASSEREVLFGGAAGGGKSYALLADPMRYFGNGNFVGIIVRRTTDELRELKWKSRVLYPKAFPGAKWREKDSLWVFPSGAQLWMTYLERDDDVLRYQGQAFSYIAFDELTHYSTPFAWNFMRSRLRTTDPTLPLFQRATTNPGNVGHCIPYGDVLTANGWKPIEEIEIGDDVYSVNIKTGLMESKPVEQVYCYSGEHNINHIKNKHLSLEFTDGHKLVYVTESGKCEFRSYSELPGQARILRSSWHWKGKSPKYIYATEKQYGLRKSRIDSPDRIRFSDYCELMGWYISEGCLVHRDKAIYIAQVKEDNRKTIKALLDRTGLPQSWNNGGVTIYSAKWYQHFASQVKSYAINKNIPHSIKNASKEDLELFINSMMLGDGHWKKPNCSGVYYTISPQLKDEFEECALKCGYIVSESNRDRKNEIRIMPNGKQPKNLHISYEVRIKKKNNATSEVNTGNHIYNVSSTSKRVTTNSRYIYKGNVYCIGVKDNHSFIVRQKNHIWVSGNSWVKKMFIDPAPPNTAFPATDIDTGETLYYPEGHKKAGQPLFLRKFVPSKLSDNPYLYVDGQYEANLLSLPEMQRRQLLEGDWSVADGAAFTEFRPKDHIIEPFDIPTQWTRFRSCDYGYASYSAVHWYAIDPAYETLIVYRELYVSKHTGKELAIRILDLEQNERISYGVLDSSVWHQRGQSGPSIAEEMMSVGCRWRPADRAAGSRTAGKNKVHELLKLSSIGYDENGNDVKKAGIVFFNTCRQIIADLPIIPADPNGKDDIDERYASDHTYDSIRYGVMSRPRSKSVFAFGDNTMVGSVQGPADRILGY